MEPNHQLAGLSFHLAKKADILLVIPPPFFTRMPHIGVAYLSRYLEHHGVAADVCDLSVKLFNASSDELRKFWKIECNNSFFATEISENILKGCAQGIDQFVDDFLATETRILGLSVNMNSLFVANEIARMVKQKDPERLIVFGGAGTFFRHPRDLIQSPAADVYVVGEGERTLLGIVQSFNAGVPLASAPGIFLKHDFGRYQPTPASEISNLDEIPFPTFNGFDLQEYNHGTDYRPLPLLLSRGCIKHCSYCIDCVMWPRYRFRSAQHVMDEIRYHVLNHQTKAFEFNDLACNGNLIQLEKLCDLIIESGYKFDWVSYAIIRKDMTLELLVKMRRAGCHTLIFGVENGSDRILGKMKKGFMAQEASQVIRLSHEAGIHTNINIIVGFPGETESDFKETIRFLERNRDHIDEITNVSGFTLFPDADVGKNKNKYGVILGEEMDPMLFEDANGLDRQARADRVVRLVDVVSRLKIHESIVNKPSLNPQVAKFLPEETPLRRSFWRKLLSRWGRR